MRKFDNEFSLKGERYTKPLLLMDIMDYNDYLAVTINTFNVKKIVRLIYHIA